LTAHLGQRARSKISCLAGKDKPFFLDLFMATAHPPFGSEYPYYSRYSDPEYSGESKFAMARLVDPFDIIRSQREPKEAFDLDQINDLYDACVRRFDDEVRDIVHHLRACGIENNTILVIYSDHGMELFEHDTWGQGNSAVGEASPRVPLVIVDPRNGYSGLDSRVVRTVDLFPTICDLCGIDQPSAMDGVSLKPYLDDEQLDYDLAAYSETGDWLVKPPGQQSKHQAYPGVLDLLDVSEDSGEITIKKDCLDLVNQARDRMIRRGKWKLVYFPLVNGVEYALYDLEQDPGCCHDVANLHLDVVSDLKRELLDWIGQ
ncbi:MAG: sulfatase-like hydrolase/transferase, partial [Candidatus Marinimicrobia bacterium]|nr:sulfatase-like hydrolase/transferase [Candidatus Neomarinimicrobiota bacterium]